MTELIRLERPSDGVALVTMTNPEIQNFGSWEAIGGLADALAEAREGGARVSVLASGVEGHWFEHAWLTDLQATMGGEPASGDPAGWFRALQEITHDDVVSIAAVNGHCGGGGAELGWACDLRIADKQARFGQPEVMIGVATGIGGTSRLARLIGRTATAEMVLDGAPMKAKRIYKLGGLNRVVDNGTCVSVSLEWAARIAARPQASVRAMKKMLKDNDDMHLTEALKNEQAIFQTVATTEAAAEGMRETQARFDAGESPADVYGKPRK